MYDPSQRRRVQCVSKTQEICCEKAEALGLLSFLSYSCIAWQDILPRSPWRAATAGIDGADPRPRGARARLRRPGRSAKVEPITDRSVTYAVVVSGHGGGRGGHADARGIHR